MSGDAVNLPVRRIVLSDGVDDRSVGNVIRDIFQINQDKSAERIELWISTHGGSIDAGMALYDVMQESETPIDVITTGCSMSMGIPILQGGVRRYATPNARLMIHKAKSGVGYGNIDEGFGTIEDAQKLEKRMHAIVARRVGMHLPAYMRFMGEIRYMMPKEALELNFIDEIRRPVRR